MMALEPCRHVDKQGEARRVRLRESVFAKAADLGKHLLGKLRREPARRHPLDEPAVKLVDHPRPPPSPHRPAELIGFPWRESGCHHRQPHRLLLEEGNAEGVFEDALDRLVGVAHRLLAAAPAQVGMNHPPLDRPRPHDRHLDDQIVEAARLEPRQHAHLRPALDLEHADGVGPRHHLIDGRILGRHGGKRQPRPPRRLDLIERPMDGGEHPERQAIDFQDSQLVEIVLVPLDDRAARHRRWLDRHQVAQIATRHHHAADVLAEMAGEADQVADEGRQPLAGVAIGIEPRLGEPLRQSIDPVADIEHLGDPCHPVERQPERLSHVAHGRAEAVADHLGGHRRARAAVGVVEVLDHLLAAVVFEVDVDVGGLAALAADEAFEENLHPGRVDRRDPEAVADRRIGRRPAPLAEDSTAAREADDVEDGEEVGLVAELGDERKLVLEKAADLLGHPVGIAFRGSTPHRLGEVSRCRRAGRHDGVGVFVAQFVEGKGAGCRPFHGAFDGPRQAREASLEPRLLVEMAFAVGEEAATDLLDRAAVTDRREGIEEGKPGADVAADVAGRHDIDPRPPAGAGKALEPSRVIPLERHLRKPTDALPKHLAPRRQPPPISIHGRQRHAGPQACRMGRDHVVRKSTADRAAIVLFLRHGAGSRCALALLLPALRRDPAVANREEAAEVCVAGPVLRPHHKRLAIDRRERGPDDERDADLLCRPVRPDDAGKRRMIGDRDPGIAEGVGRTDELLRMGGALEEGEVARDMELGVVGGLARAPGAGPRTRTCDHGSRRRHDKAPWRISPATRRRLESGEDTMDKPAPVPHLPEDPQPEDPVDIP